MISFLGGDRRLLKRKEEQRRDQRRSRGSGLGLRRVCTEDQLVVDVEEESLKKGERESVKIDILSEMALVPRLGGRDGCVDE